MANIKSLRDYNNEKLYPQTLTEAVYDENGNQLKMLLNTKITQYTILPQAGEYNGLIVQYIGETNDSYTNGYFYQSNGTRWLPKNTQIPGGVKTFNGRADNVIPQEGDYNAAMVGAVDKTGDTMTGPLTLSGDPINDMHAATKNYVDNNGKIQAIAVNGTTQPITNKTVNLQVPVSMEITNIQILTEEQYIALSERSATTLYLIKEA